MSLCEKCGSYGRTADYAKHCDRADCPKCKHGIKGDFCGDCFPKEIDTIESLRAYIKEQGVFASECSSREAEMKERFDFLTEAARELLQVCDMEQHNEDIFKGKFKKGSKAWSGEFLLKKRLGAIARLRDAVPPLPQTVPHD